MRRTSGTQRRWTLGTLVAVLLLALPVGAAATTSYDLDPEVYDIDAVAGGGVIVSQNTAVKEIHGGAIGDVAEVESVTPIGGLAGIGRGVFFAATQGGDEGVGAALWRVSHGNARMVADIAAFEREHDPSAAVFDPQCAALDEFTPGPQSNPFHIETLTGSTALIADAAGNTLLSAKTNGHVDWIALLPPVEDDEGNPLVRFEGELSGEQATCYVQPVPTSVDVGPDGAFYVGELTGDTPTDVDPRGLSRMWRIEAGARHEVCPSSECQVVVEGLTAVIDLTFGPDGSLFVLEYHEDGYPSVFGPDPVGGRIQRCDVDTGECTVVEENLHAPGAITFDASGDLWVVESNIFTPSVHRVELP